MKKNNVFEKKNKECNVCGRTDQPHFSKKRCKGCASKTYNKPKQTPLKRTALKRKPKKATGEREVFLLIWETRPHICTNCKEPLGDEPLAHFFAHIISKKRRPDLRLEPDNIFLLCWLCHYAYDFRGKVYFEKRKK